MDDPFVVYCKDDDCKTSEELTKKTKKHMGLQTFSLFKVAGNNGGSDSHKQNMIKTYPYIVVLIRFIVV